MEAFHVLVPWIDPKLKASTNVLSSYRYCLHVRTKPNGEAVLFCPADLTTYALPEKQLRKPVAYPRDVRAPWLARSIRRNLKSFKRMGRRADRTTALAVIAKLEEAA